VAQDAEEFVETAKSLCEGLKIRSPMVPSWRSELSTLHGLSAFDTSNLAGAAIGVYCPELKRRYDRGDRGD
jgi:hypothetical protein